jgi:hypothetical protein
VGVEKEKVAKRPNGFDLQMFFFFETGDRGTAPPSHVTGSCEWSEMLSVAMYIVVRPLESLRRAYQSPS